MSLLYNPDTALKNSTVFVRDLSQRDLSLLTPINFVTHPGIALTPACFGNRRYQHGAAAKCFSNLLVAGFRRLDADLFWDPSRQSWSLCPVELGGDGEPITSSTSMATAPSIQPISTTLANAIISGKNLEKRQATTSDAFSLSMAPAPTTDIPTAQTSASNTATIVANPATTSVVELGQSPSPDSDPGTIDSGTLIRVGEYSCTRDTDFALLISIISAHMANTETDLNATMVFLTLNLHVAATPSDPSGSPPQPDDQSLPQGSTLLSTIITSNASAYLYTPSDLLSQRAALNYSASWFTVLPTSQPDTAYFDFFQNGSTMSTTDGWPSESVVELTYARRMLVGYGEIDPQLAHYNFSGDAKTIFPANYMASNHNVPASTAGDCFFQPGVTELARINSSWAISSLGDGGIIPTDEIPTYIDQARNTTNCGISPILNATLGNASAGEHPEPYLAFVGGSYWSWDANEPASSPGDGETDDDDCAVLDAISGRWQAIDCGQSHYGACRVGNAPYEWRISSSDAPYARIGAACDPKQTFDAPRTALENSYLLHAWRSHRSRDEGVDKLLWLNFNDLDVSTCWVRGENSTCPYGGAPQQQARRIAVPVAGAIIVFALTALTILVKCAGHRRSSKRRSRRGDGGWDYEGVPS